MSLQLGQPCRYSGHGHPRRGLTRPAELSQQCNLQLPAADWLISAQCSTELLQRFLLKVPVVELKLDLSCFSFAKLKNSVDELQVLLWAEMFETEPGCEHGSSMFG